MAEHTKLITIDPNGDTLLKLKDIRWELPQWIDEATRFAPPVDVTGLALEDTEAEVADEDDQRTEPEEVHFLVSSRQLRLVSTYFDAMFKRDFAESVADSTDGKYHIWATEWNPEALEWLMKVAHARSPGVRSYYNIDELVQMALIVDYYDIHELPYFYVKEKLALQRARREQRISSGNTPSFGHQAVKMLFLSVVFKEETLLEEMISLAMKFSKGPLQDLGLPLGEIPSKMMVYLIVCDRANISQSSWKRIGSKLSSQSSTNWTL